MCVWGMRRYVQKVAPDCLWLALSPSLRGRVHALDSATTLERLRAFSGAYSIGRALRCTVSRVRKMPFMRLTLMR